MADMGKQPGKMVERNADRWHLVYYLRVFDGRSQQILGHVVDISEKGFMLICDEPVKVGKTFSLRMSLPNRMKDHDDVELSAISRWCKSDTDPNFYLAGFQLDDLEPAVRSLIAALLKDFSQKK